MQASKAISQVTRKEETQTDSGSAYCGIAMAEMCKLSNGCPNLGSNLCFMNAVSQMLMAAPGAMANLWTHAEGCDAFAACNTCLLLRAFTNMAVGRAHRACVSLLARVAGVAAPQ